MKNKDYGAWLKSPYKMYCPPGDIDKKYAENAIAGTWNEEEGSWFEYKVFCSECGKEPIDHILSEYCPHCGKRMVTEIIKDNKDALIDQVHIFIDRIHERICEAIGDEHEKLDTDILHEKNPYLNKQEEKMYIMSITTRTDHINFLREIDKSLKSEIKHINKITSTWREGTEDEE